MHIGSSSSSVTGITPSFLNLFPNFRTLCSLQLCLLSNHASRCARWCQLGQVPQEEEHLILWIWNGFKERLMFCRLWHFLSPCWRINALWCEVSHAGHFHATASGLFRWMTLHSWVLLPDIVDLPKGITKSEWRQFVGFLPL
jgi:hypothetical protein